MTEKRGSPDASGDAFKESESGQRGYTAQLFFSDRSFEVFEKLRADLGFEDGGVMIQRALSLLVDVKEKVLKPGKVLLILDPDTDEVTPVTLDDFPNFPPKRG